MRLILVRHADAAPAAPGQDDAARPLTPLGHEQAAALRDALRQVGVVPDAVLTSPAVRAAETAAPLAELLAAGRGVLVTDRLSVDQLRPKKMSREVMDLGAETVVLVGHMPDIGIYAGWLIGSKEDMLGFDRAGAACFTVPADDVGKGAGALDWFVNADWCRLAATTTSP